ncbi:piggyBac transposable element-derived protein 1-like [Anthonomus grandis grandis]|uniref:piggyBac transposable element-derived protein 1-like n=1 Tax=Anthonomus grandis grandis TaxID=2921223 RepID=UPI00216672A8|nr:piggyBac transposable element-derived protein 1-like [Anthonomus grandis grandis]
MLWCTDKKYVRPIIPASMSRNRFQLLTAFIRFDDFSTRPQRKINDKLAPIKEIFDLFVQNCIMAYSPGSHVTIDEQLVSFRGRCPFQVYMKSKPDKYGLKIWAMADSKNSYSINLQVYLGKINNKPEKNQGERVLLDLVEPLGTGYGVTSDNFFTSLPLADKLAEKKLTLCGTLRKNKSYIPNELQPKLFRTESSSMFAFTKEHTIVSYTPSKGKAVILLSTQHHDDTVADEKYKNKPHIILHYNDTKGAVDTTDKMVKQ